MIRKLCIEPIGVQLSKFNAEVDVVAENVQTDNILIKTWNNLYKEFTFSEDKKCWIFIKEFNKYPKIKDRWHKIIM